MQEVQRSRHTCDCDLHGDGLADILFSTNILGAHLTKWICLTRGVEAQVDDADYQALARHQWRCIIGRDGLPYAVGATRRRGTDGAARGSSRQMQRIILDPRNMRPRSTRISHRNGDTLDNRRENLMWVEDVARRRTRRLPKSNSTGFLGVHLSAEGVFRVQLQSDGRRWSGGTHMRAVDAARAYNALALRQLGPGAELNTVPDPIYDEAIYHGGKRKRRAPERAKRLGSPKSKWDHAQVDHARHLGLDISPGSGAGGV